MKIGIIEIMPKGHFTLVDSVVRIFSSDPENQIYIFTNRNGASELKTLEANSKGQIKIIVLTDNNIKAFLAQVSEIGIEKIYVTTLVKYFKEFYQFSKNISINVFIHNIDEWFQADLKFKLYTLINGFTFSSKLAYTIKISFIYPYWRKKIIKNIAANNGKFVILSSILKKELIKYIPENKIEVIPFSVYDANLEDKSKNNNMLRVCIPGLLSKARRDYYSVIKMIDENLDLFRDKIQFDFLGGITAEEKGDELLTDIKKIIEKGANIIVHEKLRIPLNEYNDELAKADIILGNMNVALTKYSYYGKTKETGVIFTMIRAGKPGILITGYPVIEELKSSTLVYNNYTELKNILLELAEDKSRLGELKLVAKRNSLNFSQEAIYHSLAGHE